MTRPRLIAFQFLAAFLLSKLSLTAHAECGDVTTCLPCTSHNRIDSCTWCSLFYGETEMEMGVCVQRRWKDAAYACANAAASLTTLGNNLSGLGFSLAPAQFACLTGENNLLTNTHDPTCRGCVMRVDSDGLPIDQHWCSLESQTHTGGLCVGSKPSCQSLAESTELTSSAVRTSPQECCETRTNCGTCETADGCGWCSLFYGDTQMEMGVCIYRGGVDAAAACTNARSTLNTLGNNLSGLGFSLAPPQTVCATLGNNLLINTSDPSCRGCVTRVDSADSRIGGHWCPLATHIETGRFSNSNIEHSGGGLCLREGVTCQWAFTDVSGLVVGQDADTLMECCSMRQQCFACGEGGYCTWCSLSGSVDTSLNMGFCVPTEASDDSCSTEALALVGRNLGGLGFVLKQPITKLVFSRSDGLSFNLTRPTIDCTTSGNNILINTNDATCTGCVTHVDTTESRFTGHWCPLERNGVKGGVCLGDEEYCSSSLSTFRGQNSSQTVTATEQCPEYCSRVRDCESCRSMSTDGCSWCALSKEGADESLRGMGVCIATGSSDQNQCPVHLSTVGHNLAALAFNLVHDSDDCPSNQSSAVALSSGPTCGDCTEYSLFVWCPLESQTAAGGLCVGSKTSCQSLGELTELTSSAVLTSPQECCETRTNCGTCETGAGCAWCSLFYEDTQMEMGVCIYRGGVDAAAACTNARDTLSTLGNNLSGLGFSLAPPQTACADHDQDADDQETPTVTVETPIGDDNDQDADDQETPTVTYFPFFNS